MATSNQHLEHEHLSPFIIANDIESAPKHTEIQKIFSEGRMEEKVTALQQLIKLIIHDNSYPRLMMTVLKHLVPCDDHEIKRLLFLYWEVVEKLKADGSVRDELLLACNTLRKDLLHSNEYIRGKTLKLVSRMMYRSILEPLIQAIMTDLEHRFSYVRRNAVSCLMNIYLAFGSEMLSDLPDRLEVLLQNETDISTKRNAFLLLFHCGQEKALDYLNNIVRSEDPLGEADDLMQLLIVELIRKTCIAEPSERNKYLSTVHVFAQSKSSAVLLECAHTLIALSRAPSSIRTAVQCYVKLLNAQNDNNIILSILGKLEELIKVKRKIEIEEHLLDLLTTLTSSSVEIRRKGFSIVLELINERTIDVIIEYIKKNLRKDKNTLVFANFWVTCIEKLAELYPIQTFSGLTLPLIDEYILIETTQSKTNDDTETVLNNVAHEVTQIARKAIALISDIEVPVVERLIAYIPEVKDPVVVTAIVWILGEYARNKEIALSALECLKSCIGSFPIVPTIKGNIAKEEKKEQPAKSKRKTKTIVLPDGTYATQVIEEQEVTKKADEKLPDEKKAHLRELLIMQEEGFLAAVLGVALSKLVLRLREDPKLYNDWAVYSLLAICSIAKAPLKPDAIDLDSKARLISAIRVLSEENKSEQDLFLSCGEDMATKAIKKLTDEKAIEQTISQQDEVKYKIDPEVIVTFRQLKGTQTALDYELEENEQEIFTFEELMEDKETVSTRTYQLTGYTDPIYVEAVIENHYHTIIVTLILINRSKKTLQNVMVETFIKEEMKPTERPQMFNFPPQQIKTLKVMYKANKTEDGSLFGYITYSSSSGNVPYVIPLNKVPLNLLDNISPKEISEKAFKKLWIELMWENKFDFVTKGTPYTFLKEFANKINLAIVSPLSEFDKTSNLLAANLYGQTKFSTLPYLTFR